MISVMRFKLVGMGAVPLLMHCNKAANPLNPYAQFLKSLTAKKKKTDQDYKEIARVEWEAGLYLHDGEVAIPGENLEACFLKAAKRTKNGQKYQSGAMVSEEWFALAYQGPKIKAEPSRHIPNDELNRYFDSFKHEQMVRVSNQQVLRTRPIFHGWSLSCGLQIDNEVLDERTVTAIIEDAGRFVGLCEKRPRLGRFDVERIE
jgi:hypothetical protein